MRFRELTLALFLTLCTMTAWGQSSGKPPHTGYLYPAGGQQGSVIQIMAGGQSFQGAADVYVSGEGVHAWVSRVIKPLTKKELRELAQQAGRLQKRQNKGDNAKPSKPLSEMTLGDLELPDHPFLQNLTGLSLVEVKKLMARYQEQQFSAQLAELAIIEVAIDNDAVPGVRELRIDTLGGLTNPMFFEVGTVSEVGEQEPNDPGVPELNSFALPAVFNGQILPGDVDRFRFQARQGQKLVFKTEARSLSPYLADAVPGWFQAAITLYDRAGKEVAYADDYQFDPDPVLYFEVPEDGEYDFEIRDAIYRGREDFVYRVSVGEQPFITAIYPLGFQQGTSVEAALTGWNLPQDHVLLDGNADMNPLSQIALRNNNFLSNAIPYAVGALPETNEAEPNDTAAQAQPVATPLTVNGRIDRAGDVDVFRIEGRTGETLVAEITARRLRSPLDSLLRILDTSGQALEWNDDYEDPAMGLLTHHADSYLSMQFPSDGTYFVQVSDAQHQGGESFAYRLRLAPPKPDFELRVTPASLNLPLLRNAAFCVHVLRGDGFDGPIDIALKDAPSGFSISGGHIPAGCDQLRMTLSGPQAALEGPVALHLEGRAEINGETVMKPATPAEDMMQAFIYRHLTPAQTLLAATAAPKWGAPKVKIAEASGVEMTCGVPAQLNVIAPPNPKLAEVQIELNDAPPGITLKETSLTDEGFQLTLIADEKALEKAPYGNLIIEAFTENTAPKAGGKPAQKKRVLLGVLPAVPFEISAR